MRLKNYHNFFDKMYFRGTIIIKREDEWFVATCLENDIASQGHTVDEALYNLKEAISLYYEDEDDAKIMLPVGNSDQVYITSLEMAL